MSQSQNATTPVPSELDGPSTPLDALAAELVLLRDVDEKLSKLKAVRTALQGKIKAALGDSEIGTVAGVPVVSHKRVTSVVLDQTVLKRNFPSVYEDCLDLTESTRFKVLKAAS